MEQMKLAKDVMAQQKLTLCVVNAGQIVFTSKDKGIVPLYKAITDRPAVFCAAVVADKVIGKAAAMILVGLGVGEVDTEVISKPAEAVLANAGVAVHYRQLVERIENRTGTGLCPAESLAMDAANVEELLPRVREFLTQAGVLEG